MTTIDPKTARDEIDTLRSWAVAVEQPFTLDSCTAAVTQSMDEDDAKAWADALAAEWSDADEVAA